MCFVLVIAPLVGAALAPLLARRTGRACGWLCAAIPAGLVIYLLNVLAALGEDTPALLATYPWAPEMGLEWSLRLDGLSVAFCLLVTGIGALVCLYADEYFRDSPRRGMFLSYTFLFMASMLGVVLADNIFLLYVFWELTTVTSYLLIGFEFQKESARVAARQALLTTVMGGLALLAGAILLGNAAGSFRLSDIIVTSNLEDHPHYLAIVLLLVVGAATKSAQFPFHFWLPSAMAAPTPASAYLHSSTMVKAGIYLLARLSPALGGTNLWFWLLVVLGMATMAVGAWQTLQQVELKPILAYSTITALGMLVACIGLGTPLAIKAFVAFLFVHALYKAALFMVAGALIHETGETRYERLGGLRRALPFTAAASLLAAASMAGLPPLLGYIGKESIYEAALEDSAAGSVLLVVMVLANATNVFVAIAVGGLPFFRRSGAHERPAHRAALGLWLGPLVLGVLGLAAGLFPAFLGTSILEPAAGAVLGGHVPVHLKLWHGLNTVLLMSGLTLLLGVVAVLVRRPWRRFSAPLKILDRVGPEALYHRVVAGMLRVAEMQTNAVQHGYLRYYLVAILVCFIGAVMGALQLRVRADVLALETVALHELLTVALIAIAAIATTRVQTRFGALACLGVVGYGVALLYVYYSAPDLAKTQVVVESLVVVFFSLLAAAMPDFKNLSSPAVRHRDALIAAAAGGLMGLLVYGTVTSNQLQPIAEFYRANSAPLAHGRNVVNVILVDFRALDTLGEITVLAVAAFGARALLRMRRNHKGLP